MAIDASPRNAAHLLRRAAWGGNADDVARVVGDGVEATVDRLLDPSDAPVLREPRRKAGRYPYAQHDFQYWFLHHCAGSSTPAIERLLWFWHGHFATSTKKVDYADLMFRQFATLRRHSLGRFDDLLLAMVHDPAMNQWLDLGESVAGRANENFARELLELFSMGSGNGYTQADVVAASRALTGFALVDRDELPRPARVELRPELHDFGIKSFLGHTGNLDADDIVAAVTERRECRRFLVRRMWLRYAGTEALPEVVDELAEVFGERLVISDLLRAMFLHPRFYAEEVRGGLVTQPVEIVVRVLRNFEVPLVDIAEVGMDEVDDDWVSGPVGPWTVLNWTSLMGQRPGLPPNVGGWPHNRAWLTSNRAAARLITGTEIGWYLTAAEMQSTDELRSLQSQPDRFVAALLNRFGVVEWSDDTAGAISTAASGSDNYAALAAAIATAFTSPEVTLA